MAKDYVIERRALGGPLGEGERMAIGATEYESDALLIADAALEVLGRGSEVFVLYRGRTIKQMFRG